MQLQGAPEDMGGPFQVVLVSSLMDNAAMLLNKEMEIVLKS